MFIEVIWEKNDDKGNSYFQAESIGQAKRIFMQKYPERVIMEIGEDIEYKMWLENEKKRI